MRKRCGVCGVSKPLTAFYSVRGRKDQTLGAVMSSCKECQKEQKKQKYVPRPPRELTCQVCGTLIVQTGAGRPQKFCPDCRRNRPPRRKSSVAPILAYVCKGCGFTFYRRDSYKKSEPPTFCTHACYTAYRPGPVRGPSSRVHCGLCPTCNTWFTSRRKRSYCSDECAYERRLDNLKSWYALAAGMTMESRYWRGGLIKFLRNRDGDECQLCHGAFGPIRWQLASGTKGDPSRLGPSIDHITPVTRGGSDEIGNLQLAHWKCNQARGNRGLPQAQLTLGLGAA